VQSHAFNYEKTVLVDLARTQADKMDHIYSLMESFKNGRIFSPKYENISKTFVYIYIATDSIRQHT
jgi:hypothetical protein